MSVMLWPSQMPRTTKESKSTYKPVKVGSWSSAEAVQVVFSTLLVAGILAGIYWLVFDGALGQLAEMIKIGGME